jgi:predicted PolB exonuclease-like 3'-5' exonuclease
MIRVYLDIETYSKGDEPSVNDKVIAIGVMEGGPSGQKLFTEWGYGGERDVISKFYKELRMYSEQRATVIGFNILRFDIPILSFKGVKYEVGGAQKMYDLWHNLFVIDYLQVALPLKGMMFKGLTLAYLAKLLREKGVANVPKKKEKGKVIKTLYERKRFEEIEKHLITDLEIIRLVDQNNEMLFRGTSPRFRGRSILMGGASGSSRTRLPRR